MADWKCPHCGGTIGEVHVVATNPTAANPLPIWQWVPTPTTAAPPACWQPTIVTDVTNTAPARSGPAQ